MSKQAEYKYNGLARVLHWGSAVAIVALFALGSWMVELDYEHAWYEVFFYYHEGIGILAAILIAFRLFWRLITSQPKLCSKSAHMSMYGLCIAIFVSGYLIPTANGRSIVVFNWFLVSALGSFHHLQADITGMLHFGLAAVLISLVSLHAIAACKHHFLDKNNTLKKML
ncbi:MAG: cytochrome b [Arenicella sp.]